MLEVAATDSGVLESILEEEGAIVLAKQPLCFIHFNDSTGISVVVKETTESSPAKHHPATLEE